MLICDISVLNRMGKILLDERLKKVGFIWREMVVLMVLEEKPGATQNFVASFLQTDKANVSNLITSMEERDLIERRTCEEDRRYKGLYLTGKARDYLPQLHKIMNEWEKECYSSLNQDELQVYKKLTKKIMDNMFAGKDGEKI